MAMGYGIPQTFRRIGFKEEHAFFVITLRCLIACEEFRLQNEVIRRGAILKNTCTQSYGFRLDWLNLGLCSMPHAYYRIIYIEYDW